MNRQICTATDQDLWRIRLKELKNRSGKSAKQIADGINSSEKCVSRILSGEAKNPSLTVVKSMISYLGGSVTEIFAESDVVIGGKDLVALQDEVNRLTAEIDTLKMQLKHKEELLALHNHYNKINPNN